MNIRIFIVLIVFFSFGLKSCVKEEIDYVNDCMCDCTIIKGKYTTANGNLGLANVELVINWINIPNFFGGIVREKAKTKTDSEGNYELKFLIKDDELIDGYFALEYKVDKSKYLVLDDSKIGLLEAKRDTTIFLNYLIPKKSFVEWRLLNSDKIGPIDIFFTEFVSRMGYDCQCCSGTVLFWSGGGLPSSKKIEVAGDQPLYIKTMKNTNGIVSEKVDTVYIKAGETILYTVDFLESYTR